jgi:hypothetical protein
MTAPQDKLLDPAVFTGRIHLDGPWVGYHRLGAARYREPGLRYPVPDTVPPTGERLAAAARHFTGRGLRVTT